MAIKEAVEYSKLPWGKALDEDNKPSLAWEGGEILKALANPPMVYKTLDGFVAVAVLAEDIVVGVTEKTLVKAMHKLCEECRAMITFRECKSIVWKHQNKPNAKPT